MQNHHKTIVVVFSILLLTMLFAGCGMMTPAPKPEIGPAGKPPESEANPPFAQRFWSPPGQLYDLEATAGVVFEGLSSEVWGQAQDGLANLHLIWSQAKPLVGNKKGVKEADAALNKLTNAITNRKMADSQKSLNTFMNAISEIGKSYKLSPLSDIILIGNTLRNVSFYAQDEDWKTTESKIKDLETTWNQVKPVMEQFGILNQVTITHSNVKQLKDAVDAENRDAFEESLVNLNESLGRIRDFFRGK